MKVKLKVVKKADFKLILHLTIIHENLIQICQNKLQFLKPGGHVPGKPGPDQRTGPLDRLSGPDKQTGPDWISGPDHWTGPLDRLNGLDWATGSAQRTGPDQQTGLDHWTGSADRTGPSQLFGLAVVVVHDGERLVIARLVHVLAHVGPVEPGGLGVGVATGQELEGHPPKADLWLLKETFTPRGQFVQLGQDKPRLPVGQTCTSTVTVVQILCQFVSTNEHVLH